MAPKIFTLCCLRLVVNKSILISVRRFLTIRLSWEHQRRCVPIFELKERDHLVNYADPPSISLQIMAPKKNEMLQALLNQKIKEASKPAIDYSKMDLKSLGQIRLEAGRKYPGKTFKEIYETDDSYNQWVLSHVEEDSGNDKGVPLFCHYLCRRLKEEVQVEKKDQPQGSDLPPSASKDTGYKSEAEQQLAEMKKAANLKSLPGSLEDEDLDSWSKWKRWKSTCRQCTSTCTT